jgi:hypothetical protein
MVLKNRVMQRIFGPKRDDVTRGWRKLQNEELHNLRFPPDTIRVITSWRTRWVGHVACMGDMTNVYKSLVVKPEGKRLLRTPRCRCVRGSEGYRMAVCGLDSVAQDS